MTPAECQTFINGLHMRSAPLAAPVVEGDIVVCTFNRNGFAHAVTGEVARAKSGPGRGVAEASVSIIDGRAVAYVHDMGRVMTDVRLATAVEAESFRATCLASYREAHEDPATEMLRAGNRLLAALAVGEATAAQTDY